MKTENQFPIELQDHATLMELKEKLKKVRHGSCFKLAGSDESVSNHPRN